MLSELQERAKTFFQCICCVSHYYICYSHKLVNISLVCAVIFAICISTAHSLVIVARGRAYITTDEVLRLTLTTLLLDTRVF